MDNHKPTDSASVPSVMLANILEQAAVAKRCLALPLALPDAYRQVQHVDIAACGSSRHAALVARAWFEHYAQLPTRVFDASDYADNLPLALPNSLLMLISQSGFTADVLSAGKAERSRSKTPLLAITNAAKTPLQASADSTIITPAGPEQAVASTKTFLAQLMILLRLALQFAAARQSSTGSTIAALQLQIETLPALIQTTLEGQFLHGELKAAAIAEQMASAASLIALGCGVNVPIGMEAALKLKETAYLHAEGLAAGDFMHGPLAMVKPGLPVVAMAIPGSGNYRRVVAHADRVKDCGGVVIGITTRSNVATLARWDAVLPIADIDKWLSPILTVIPLQLLAYSVALQRGLNVDRPRNITKFIG
jgi:glucosamine 6-phosphate synthetase-like amidotransferase/phosphosugar isomerase protein